MHRSLLKRFPLFIWLLMPLSSVPNFRPDTGRRRWSLVQVRWFSRAAGMEGHCRHIAGVCGEHSQCSGHTGFVPARGCVLSPSTLLRLPAALYRAGPAWRVVPVFGYSTKARTRLGLRFVPSPAAAQAARSLTGALSPLKRAFSPPWSQPVSAHAGPMRRELASSCDPPGGC